jgi:multiple sugar transport system permease protein
MYNTRLKKIFNKKEESIIAYSFIFPGFLGMLLFIFLPMLFTIFLSFSKWNLSETRIVGLQNYFDMFLDERIRRAIVNNLIYLLNVPLSISISLLLAAAMDKFVFFRKTLRVLYFIPFISSMVAVSIVWKTLFSPDFGPVNEVLRQLFQIKNPPHWFMGTKSVMPSLVILAVWHDIGNSTIILIAGMQRIPTELYEAASVDGASGWQKFRMITIPLLTPFIFFLVIIGIINSFKVFDSVKIVTGGGPGQSSNVLVYVIYYYGFKLYEMGYASAISIFVFVLILFVTLIQFKMQSKWVNY